MDLASLIGLIMAFVLVIFGITAEDGFGALIGFLDYQSALITFGGAFMAVMVMQPSIPLFLKKLKSISMIFKVQATNELEMIKNIIQLSNVARKEGLLALEEAANGMEDEFMKKGLLLIVDGTDPELVRSILETELNCIEERHKDNITFWDNLASMGPAWGMIGTLIGLINMLGKLQDMATVGPNMAIALITTLYGSLLANWICTPTANKMRINNGAELKVKEILVEGLLSIQAGENPRVIEEKLKSFLTPGQREELTTEGGEEIG
ncbi:MAG: motility protein A [Lachnospiraceae bacterium]|nr:motility protein A [Lachnospiraceae bacterium]